MGSGGVPDGSNDNWELSCTLHHAPLLLRLYPGLVFQRVCVRLKPAPVGRGVERNDAEERL